MNIGKEGIRACHAIRQYVEVVNNSEKLSRLRKLLERIMDGKSKVCCSRVDGSTADKVD